MRTANHNNLNYSDVIHYLHTKSYNWLITGVAGFIGSNLLEALLKLNQRVIGLDNFSTGFQSNLDDVKIKVSGEQWSNFTFIEGDIRDPKTCLAVCNNIDYILHQAALCSVERSIHDPISTSTNNIDGFLNMLVAARDRAIKRFVYASSCAVYGDCEELPLTEEKKGNLLSPYSADKHINELHAGLFSRIFNLQTIGLRYFNIFGPRQDSNSSYSSVIARWLTALICNQEVYIYGDGKTTRDFCYIEDCIQANILAACTKNPEAINHVYNIGSGKQLSLNELYEFIQKTIMKFNHNVNDPSPVYKDFRHGDIRHSLADISKASKVLGYESKYSIQEGLDLTADWYVNKQQN